MTTSFSHPHLSAVPLTVTIPGDANSSTVGSIGIPGSTGDLRYLLNLININNAGTYTIDFNLTAGNESITLGNILPPLNLTGINDITINGNNVLGSGTAITIVGNPFLPGFMVRQGNPTTNILLQNMTLMNTASRGGTGSGGALGAGGGLFIIGAPVTVSNLTFVNNTAQGGDAIVASTLSGGGMYGGSGFAGGGGMSGNGNGGGGGFGIGADGGFPSSNGIDGAAFGAGPGGNSIGGGTRTGGLTGGGGGGFTAAIGGGGGGVNGSSTSTSSGGNGGFGGGGGGDATAGGVGGTGGFGGGGGRGESSNGSGGFGGGGARVVSPSIPGSNGGFGGGGASGGTTGGFGGVGAGSGTSAGGGGGAGLGGAIFINNSLTYGEGGGSLIVVGPLSFSGCTVTGGLPAGANPGQGAAASTAIFSTTGANPLIFSPGISDTIAINGSIGDDSNFTLPGGTYTPGTALGAPISMLGLGTLNLLVNNTYSGGTNINSGTVQVFTNQAAGNPASSINFTGNGTLQAGVAALAVINPVTIGNAVGSVNSNGFVFTLSGNITGIGALQKTGTGTLSLTNGGNNFSGGTIINQGTLQLLATGILNSAGAVNVNSPGIFQISGITATSLTIGDLSGNGTVNLGSKELITGTSLPSTFSGDIQGAGGKLTKQGLGTLTLSGTSSYTGQTKINAGVLQLTTNSLDPTGGILLNGGTALFNQAFFGAYSGNISGTSNLVAQGGGTIIFTGNISGTTNLAVQGGGLIILNGTNSYSGGTTVSSSTTLSGTPPSIQGDIVNSGIVNFEEPAGPSATYAGVISGSGITQINGFGSTGTVNFSNAQAYTNQTIINSGTLALTASGSLSTTALLQINPAGTFNISGIAGASTTVGNLAGSGVIALGTKNLATLTSTLNATYGGSIQGAGTFEKLGAGTLTLTGLSTFVGPATVTAGILRISTNSLTSDIVTVATLDFNQAFNGTYAGGISGAGAVLINGGGGTGTVTLSGSLSQTGLTTVVGGELVISRNILSSFAGPFVLNTGAIIDFEQTASTGTYSGSIGGAGNVHINELGGVGTVILSGPRTYSGTTTVFNGTLQLPSTTTSTSSGSILVNLGANVDFEQSAGTIGTYVGGVSGAGNVIANQFGGTGKVVLSGINSYTGTTTVDNGILKIYNTASTSISSAITINSPGTLDLEQFPLTTGTYSGGISGNGSLAVNQDGSTGTVSLTGPIGGFTGTTTVFAGTLSGILSSLPSLIKVNTGGTVDLVQAIGTGTYTGAIQDNGAGQHGAVAINKQGGSGIIILSGANSYTGGTTIYGGTLQGTPASLQGAFKINSGALLDIEQLAGSGTFTGTIADNGATQHGAVAINNQGGLGTVVFANSNTYTGGTTVFSGTLQGSPVTIPGNAVVNAGAFIDIEQTTGTGIFSGNLSGGGAVIINGQGGTGTVVFAGTSSYTGGTTVSSGTLQGTTSSLFGTITDNATLTFSQAFDGAFSGSIVGGGIINITGQGTVHFTSNQNLFSGTTNIHDGRLTLNSILGGNVFVKDGGHLSGTGTILGNLTVQNGGVVRPGNSIGTLNIIGNYVQESGSFYAVQIDNNAQSSLLNIQGQATLLPGSGLLVVPINGLLSYNTRYTILTAAGGLSGTFSVLATTNPLLLPVATYDANNAYLSVDVNFNLISNTFNQQQVAQQLSSPSAAANPAVNAILNELVQLPLEEASKALSQMSAEQYTNAIMTAELSNRQFIKRLYEPLRTIITTNPCTPSQFCHPPQPVETWLSVSGGRTFIHGNENARGFRIANYQISAGAQTTLCKRWTLGAAASYEKDSLGYRVGGSGTCNTILGALYGLYRTKRFYALTDVILGYSNDQVKRTINVGSLHLRPHGQPKIRQASVYAEIGTDYGFNFILVQPFLGLEWGYNNFNGFSESGGSPLAVKVFRKAHNNAYSRLGVHFSSAPLRCGFTMAVDLAWHYRLTSLDNAIDVQFEEFGSKFKIKGLPFNRNSYEGIIRFTQIIARNWELYFESTGEGWEDSFSYSFVGGIKTTW